MKNYSTRNADNFVFLSLEPIAAGANYSNVKKAYLSNESLYASFKKNPVSFLDACEPINKSCGSSFRGIVESWKSRNGKQINFFIAKRTLESDLY